MLAPPRHEEMENKRTEEDEARDRASGKDKECRIHPVTFGDRTCNNLRDPISTYIRYRKELDVLSSTDGHAPMTRNNS